MQTGDNPGGDAASRFLVSGELVLDRQDHRAWYSGSPLALGGKALAILEELMLARGTLVAKDRLFDVAWPGQAVSDSVLTTAIKELRRALGDEARAPQWIGTQHGKGYRFLPDVEVRPIHPGRQKDPKPLGGARRFQPTLTMVSLAVLALVAGITFWLLHKPGGSADTKAEQTAQIASVQRLAILPFEVKAGEEWLGKAVSSRIEDVLENAPDLVVIDSRIAAEIDSGDHAVLAPKHNIGTLVSGSVARDGRALAITVTIAGPDGAERWSRQFSDSGGDLIALVEQVAFETARALETAADPDKLEQMAHVGTRSLAAFEAHARAEYLLESIESFRDPSRVDEALVSLREAVTIDPTFASAAANLAWFEFPGPYSKDAAAGEARAVTLMDLAIEHAASPLDRRLARALLDTRMLRLDTARRELLALYEEDGIRGTGKGHSVLLQLSDIAGLLADRDLSEFAWRELTEYNLARGRVQMRDPIAIAHSPDLLGRYASLQAQQTPTPIGMYYRHLALLLAGQTDDARAVLEQVDDGAFGPYEPVARVGQLCADGKTSEARKQARERIAAIGKRSMLGWMLARLSGLQAESKAQLPTSPDPAGQRAMATLALQPGFDARDYPVIANAIDAAGATPRQTPRPDFYCPVTPG